MGQLNIDPKGWHAAVAVVIIIGLVIFRFMSFQDKNRATRFPRFFLTAHGRVL